MHNENGAWQMIFGVNTIPSCRKKGYAGELIKAAIEDSQKTGAQRPGTYLQGQTDPLLCKIRFRKRRRFPVCPRKCGMVSDETDFLNK